VPCAPLTGYVSSALAVGATLFGLKLAATRASAFRRLRVRYDQRADIHEAFLSLACALICWHALRKSWMPS
jgi:hypothetical protein